MGNRAHLKPPNRGWKRLKRMATDEQSVVARHIKALFSPQFASRQFLIPHSTNINISVPPGGIRLSMPKRDPFRGVGAGPQYHPCDLNEYNPPWDTTKTSQNMSRPCSRRMSLHTRSLTFHYTWWCSTCWIWHRPRLCPRASTHCSHRNHPQSRRFGFDARLLPAPIVHQSKGTVLSWHGLMFRSCSAYYSYLRPGASTAPLHSQ